MPKVLGDVSDVINVGLDDLYLWLIFGVVTGSIYAIAATGLVVTYTTSGIFNFAHGAVGMLAAFVYWFVTVETGIPEFIGLAVVVLLCSPLLGALVERVIMRGLAGTAEVTKLVVTVALMVAFLGVAQVIWPQDEARRTPEFFADTTSLEVPGGGGIVFVTWQQIMVLALAATVALLVTGLLKGTRTGVAMRAVVDSRELTQLNGARPFVLSMISWAVGFGLAGLAGVLTSAGESNLNVFALTFLVVNAYAAAMFGRLKSIPMAFAGGLVLGVLVETFKNLLTVERLPVLDNSFLFWDDLVWITELKNATPIIVLFIALLVLRPESVRSHSSSSVRQLVPLPAWRTAFLGAGAMVAVSVVVVAISGGDSDWLNMAARTGIFAMLALSLIPLAGYAGQMSLAQVGLAGVGAIVMVNWHIGGPAEDVLGLAAAFVVTGLAGALMALPALRLRGIYLALATFAFAVFLDQVVFRQDFAFKGSSIRHLDDFDLFGFVLNADNDNGRMVIFLAVMCAAMTLMVVSIRRGPFGRRLQAMKDSPAACATLGINLTRTKFEVFGLSAGMAGVVGALWISFAVSLPQTQFEPTQSLVILLMAVAGGVTMVSGAFIAGVLFAGFEFWPDVTNRLSLRFFNPDVAESTTEFVTKLMLLAPGLIGISLGRNPSGMAAQILGYVRRDTDLNLDGVADADERGSGLETAGIDRPLTLDDADRADEVLQLSGITSALRRRQRPLRTREISAAPIERVGAD